MTLCATLMVVVVVVVAVLPEVRGVDIAVHPFDPPVPFPKYWKRSFGSCHAALAWRSEAWKQQLVQSRKDLGVESVRFHGLFDDDMAVVSGSLAHPVYNFSRVFELYDFLLNDAHVLPVVELSFMPRLLANCGDSCITQNAYKAVVNPPYQNNFTLWYDLVRAFTKGATERYGAGAVKEWYFEVWNEPGPASMGPFNTTYMALYNASVAAIKGVNPEYRVGGPATATLSQLPDFVARLRELELPADFISSHFYETDYCWTGADRDCFAHAIEAAAKEVKETKLPFLLTEYNAGWQDPTRLWGSFASSFVMRNVQLLAGVVEVFSYWTFSDVFEEIGLPSKEFEGRNFGALTLHGVPKPVYRSFQLLAGSGDFSPPVSVAGGNGSITAFATVTTPGMPDLGGLQIFVTNHDPQGWPTTPHIVHVKIHGVRTSDPPLSALLTLINDNCTNPHREFVRMGSPANLTDAQLGRLLQASQVGHATVAVEHSGDTLSFNFTVEAHGVVHVRLV